MYTDTETKWLEIKRFEKHKQTMISEKKTGLRANEIGCINLPIQISTSLKLSLIQSKKKTAFDQEVGSNFMVD